MSRVTHPAVAQAWRWACAWDVAARKPGNVSHASAGHRMQAGQFLRSADAAAVAIAAVGAGVGERIEGAVAATWAAVGCNTNLGIVLLCAPLARAAEQLGTPGAAPPALRAALATVLDGLDEQDSAACFRAIRLAQPAGLGQAEAQDVHAEPTLALRAVMALAAPRDRIARQYRDGFDELFTLGLSAWAGAPAIDPAWPPSEAQHGALAQAVQRVFLAWLASAPDAHIVRKHGPAAAQSVMDEAAAWQRRAVVGADLEADPAWSAWDASLKGRGWNPGTSADLTVATLFLLALGAQGPVRGADQG